MLLPYYLNESINGVNCAWIALLKSLPEIVEVVWSIVKPSPIGNIVFSIFAGKYFEDNHVEVIDNKYFIKNHLNFNQIKLVYNDECIDIEYINLESDKMDIHINEIDFKVINDNDLFNLNEEYFKYDLRHED